MENTDPQNSGNETPTVNKGVVEMNVEEVQGNIRSKASWFFWIAGLSLVNTFLATRGSYFIIGLAVSQFIDGVVIELTGDINYFISLLAPGLFALFGFFAYRLHRWAFIVGSLVYILDGLLYLYFETWLAAGFHVFVLYNLYQGYKSITEYEEEKAKLV